MGNATPKHMSQALMRRFIAYRLQERQHGGLSPTALRALERWAAPGSVNTRPRPTLRPGVRLVRSWQGKTHTVEVTDRGYVWQGQIHRSLSTIARAITGTRWSGPRFFGLQDTHGKTRPAR